MEHFDDFKNLAPGAEGLGNLSRPVVLTWGHALSQGASSASFR